MLASISDNVLASSEGIPRAREANQAVPKLLIAGPRAYPAFVGIQSDIRAIVFWYLVVLGSYRLKRADRGPTPLLEPSGVELLGGLAIGADAPAPARLSGPAFAAMAIP